MDTNTLPSNPSPKNTKFQVTLALCLLLAIINAFLLYNWFTASRNKMQETSQTPVEKESSLKLPTDAIKISGCIPHEGEHWVQPDKLPYGPFYVTYGNKVTAVEYMFTEKDIKGKDLAHMTFPETLAYMEKNQMSLSDIVNEIEAPFILPETAEVKSLSIHWTAPHVGILTPHFDLHMWLVNREELAQICPNSSMQEVLPESLLKELQQRGVPIPGADAPPTASPTAITN